MLAPTLQLERCTNKQNGLADVEDPYAIDLKYLRLVVIDSADSNYRCKSWGDAMQDEKHDLGASFKRLIASQDRLVWLVSHYPVFDLRPSKKCTKDVSKECKYCDSLFKLHELVAPALVGTKVDAVLSGDIHHYEILHAHVGSHWQTMQFVAGNSGTALDGATKNSDCLGSAPSAPVYCKGKLDDSRGYMAGHFDVEARLRNVFGFLVATWDQSSKTWQFQLHTLRQEDQTDHRQRGAQAKSAGAVLVTCRHGRRPGGVEGPQPDAAGGGPRPRQAARSRGHGLPPPHLASVRPWSPRC